MCRVLSFPQSRIWVRLCKTWQTVELQISCVEVMDVPNKWGLSDSSSLPTRSSSDMICQGQMVSSSPQP